MIDLKHKRKVINKAEFESLKPFNKMAKRAEELTGNSPEKYWFQVSFEITKDCDRYGYAVLESHKR